MKILALDSSGMVASVALTQDGSLSAEYTVNYKKTHSQTLLPMLQEICSMVEVQLDTVDAIAISAGPGSFTGLRIGSASAKGLGLALKKPLVEVPTLEGLAYQLWGTDKLVCPIMDARRNQVYTGIYGFTPQGQDCTMDVLWEQRAVDIMDVIEKCNELGRAVIFLGDGVPVFAGKLAEYLKVPYSFAPAHCNRQSAAAVAALAGVYYAQGKNVVPAAEHEPEYLRLSQAERERKAAMGDAGAKLPGDAAQAEGEAACVSR